jgi:transcriptional regulator with GAF, ATPase, and Fis domain
MTSAGQVSSAVPMRRYAASRTASARARGAPDRRAAIERQAILEALKMSNWVQKDAAELLAISPRVMIGELRFGGAAP